MTTTIPCPDQLARRSGCLHVHRHQAHATANHYWIDAAVALLLVVVAAAAWRPFAAGRDSF